MITRGCDDGGIDNISLPNQGLVDASDKLTIQKKQSKINSHFITQSTSDKKLTASTFTNIRDSNKRQKLNPNFTPNQRSSKKETENDT